jgi:serine/threonine protein kinase
MQMNAKNKDPIFPELFPEDLKDLIASMLNKAPELRPDASQALAHKFFN